MGKRLVAVFCMILLAAGGLMITLLLEATDGGYVAAANQQSRCTVTVASTRGRIYDCRMRPLAGGRTQYRAVITPSPQTIAHLTKTADPGTLSALEDKLRGTSPFVAVVSDGSLEGDGVTVFKTESRYAANSVASHTVGHLDSSGHGACGIESSYDDYLSSVSGKLTATFQINAGGRSLSGTEPEITDTTGDSRAGVVLTIDTDIQLIAERAAANHISRGAVVIMEVPSGKIRASVSMPGYSQTNVAASLNDDAAPLINRAMTAYDIGSIFKLVVAAAALESGIPPEYAYECTGCVEVGDNIFHCSNRSGHGVIDMAHAISTSCNTYFINLAQMLGGDTLIEYARRFGIGEQIELAYNYATAAGTLPTNEDLLRPAALANFSFGQGNLLVTPVHAAKIIASIACSGQSIDPVIFEGLVDANGSMITTPIPGEVTRTMSEQTAGLLTDFMKLSVAEGTGRAGASDKISCAAKTGTAQTGIIINGKRILQAWFAGFFPAESPRYVCVVLVEGGSSGGAAAGPVFREIAEVLSLSL